MKVKIKEAEERKAEIQDRMELVSMKNLDQLMITIILPKFKEEWEDPQFEATKYLAVIFKFWLRKGMFPDRKPDIHSIAVKFKCSHMQLQKYLRGYHKPPSMKQPTVQWKKRWRVMLFEEMDDVDTKNMVPKKKKFKVRKGKLHKRLGVSWL